MKFTLTQDKGSFRISFTLDGKRKRFYPGVQDEPAALLVCRQMTLDWDIGQFDLSLEKYKYRTKTQQGRIPKAEPPTRTAPTKLIDLWDRWVESLELPERTKNGHYHCIRQMIQRFDPACYLLVCSMQRTLFGLHVQHPQDLPQVLLRLGKA